MEVIFNIEIFKAAFTTKELRDLTKMDLGICGDQEYLKNLIFQNSENLKEDIPKKRLLNLLCDNMNTKPNSSRKCHFVFEKSPTRLTLDENNEISGIVFENNKIKDGQAVGLNTFETINAGLVIAAIGYKGECVDPNIPWSNKLSRIPNSFGRILGPQGIIPALYVSGWLKTGPIGNIASTLISSLETAHSISEDKELLDKNDPVSSIEDILCKAGKNLISSQGWKKIDAYEIESGKELGKIREKLVNIEDIYRISNS